MPAGVEGLARLNAKLDRMPRTARKRMREALEAIAKELVRSQKTLAERSRHTGRVINSIRSRDGDNELSIEVVAGEGDAFYARFVEFGTVKAPARPFFFPPYRLLKKRMKTRTRSAISKSVKEAVGGG
jgi:HK97 gp10 family phage protein